MDSSRARMIAEVIKHLEGMDADHLSGEMAPKGMMDKSMMVEVEPGAEHMKEMAMGKEDMGSEKGPMEMLMENGTDSKSEMGDEGDISDEEMEELAMLGK
jgi:hypothetical protein